MSLPSRRLTDTTAIIARIAADTRPIEALPVLGLEAFGLLVVLLDVPDELLPEPEPPELPGVPEELLPDSGPLVLSGKLEEPFSGSDPLEPSGKLEVLSGLDSLVLPGKLEVPSDSVPLVVPGKLEASSGLSELSGSVLPPLELLSKLGFLLLSVGVF